MITYHEINEVLGKMAALDGRIQELRQILASVCRLSDEITHVNDDLTTDREHFRSEIRAVEVLQDILNKHVYNQPDRTSVDPRDFGREDTNSVPPTARDRRTPEPNGGDSLT